VAPAPAWGEYLEAGGLNKGNIPLMATKGIEIQTDAEIEMALDEDDCG
jgi:hypothetical protein